MYGITEEFKKVIAENKIQYYRAETVAWKVLAIANEVIDMVATIAEHKAVGEHKEAIAAVDKMIFFMPEKEIFIEPYYDQYLFGREWERICEGMREKVLTDNLIS